MNREKFLIVLAALFLGVMTIFLTGAVFLFLLFGLICYLIYRNTPEADRRFVLIVMITGFLLRVFLAVALHAIVYLKGYHCISGDDLLYTLKAWGIACGWENKPNFWLGNIFAETIYGVNPLTYVIAFFYRIFGFHPVTSKIINCIIGTSIGWFAYLIAREIFDRKTARIAMFIVMFYPSLVRWSAANLKDPITIFAFTGCVYILIIAARRSIVLWKYIMLLSMLGILYYFPHKFYFAIIVCGIGILIIYKSLDVLIKAGLKKLHVLRAGYIFIMTLVLSALYLYPIPLVKFLFDCEKKQTTMAGADYAGYYLYTNGLVHSMNLGLINVSELIKVVCDNIFYFMLTPFPSQMLVSRERLIAMPQMLLWYLVLILSVFGFTKLLLRRPRTAVLIGVILAIGITINAMVEGNIGSALRHRDVFTPFFVIFASSIISELIFKSNDADKDSYQGRTQ